MSHIKQKFMHGSHLKLDETSSPVHITCGQAVLLGFQLPASITLQAEKDKVRNGGYFILYLKNKNSCMLQAMINELPDLYSYLTFVDSLFNDSSTIIYICYIYNFDN